MLPAREADAIPGVSAEYREEIKELQTITGQSLTWRARNVIAPAAALLLTPLAARAQVPDNYMLDQYFAQGVPGYTNQEGTTVLSRARPEYDPLGIRVGDFIIRPELDESVGYNSNVIGQQPAVGSAVIETSATIKVGSDWARNSLGGSFNVTNTQVPSVSSQSNTTWNAAIGGSYDIGRDTLTVAATHMNAFILPYGIDVVSFNHPGVLYFAPIPYSLNDVRVGYTSNFGRFSLTPAFDFTNVTYRTTNYFGLDGFVPPAAVNGFVLGSPQDLSYLNHDIYMGSLMAQYEYAPLRDFVAMVRGSSIQYTSPGSSALYGPSRNGTAFDALVGLDYTANGVWRYRLLAGYETRQYQNFKTHSAPVFEADVIWQPQAVTTVTLKGERAIEDAVDLDVAGYVQTQARLQVDHEVRRNIILSGYGSIVNAQYLDSGGGAETFFGAGAGVTWLINRNVHVALTYDWLDHNGVNGFGPNYLQNVAMLQLRLGI